MKVLVTVSYPDNRCRVLQINIFRFQSVCIKFNSMAAKGIQQIILFPFMDLHNGLHGSYRTSPQPLRTFGAIISTEVSSYKVNPESQYRLSTVGFIEKGALSGQDRWVLRGLLKGLTVDAVSKNDPIRYILETNTRISLVHLYSTTPRYIFSSQSISLLYLSHAWTSIFHRGAATSQNTKPRRQTQIFFCSLGKIQ